MKITSLNPGMVVYDVHSQKMGNTTVRSMGVWRVVISEIDPIGRWVKASWNGNPVSFYYSKTFSKWRKEKPFMIEGLFGQKRLATREEKKQLQSK